MKRRSLSRRAILAVFAIEFLCAAAFSGTALWHERNTRIEALDATIRGRSDSLIGAVQDAEDPAANVLIDPAEFTPDPHDLYAVYNPDGRVVGSSSDRAAALVVRGSEGFYDLWMHHRRYRALQRNGLRIIDREETHGVGLRRPVVLIYAVPADHVWHEIDDAARFYIFLSLGLLSATVIVFVILVQRIFQPVRELATRAERVTVTSLTFEAPQSALEATELKPLAEALADTVARLRYAFEQEKRFINDATHELKTAVAVVRSTIQLLTMRERSVAEYEAGLRKTLADNERVEELVARMLTLGRYQDDVRKDLCPLDLGVSATTTMQRLSSIADARGVQLICNMAEGCMVRIAEEAAEILVSNLAMNAIQHSPANSIVCVSVHPAESVGTCIELEVADRGTGIAPENLANVFERFFREDPSRSRATGGAGLGLSICKGIVEGVGGSIALESHPGRGTVVKVLFRLA